jgi:hypothetical protein
VFRFVLYIDGSWDGSINSSEITDAITYLQATGGDVTKVIFGEHDMWYVEGYSDDGF